MTARDLIGRIHERTKAIWLTEPEDLQRLRNGVIDSGAGSYGQVFTTLLFAQSEIRGLAYYASTAILNLARDQSFTLEQLKKMARAHFVYRAGFLNYVGLHELGSLYQEYFAVLDRLETREEFIELTQAIKSYGARLHLWTEHVFPWGLGAHMAQRTAAEARQLLADISRGPWKPVPYMTK
jgi:hypothetical protein